MQHQLTPFAALEKRAFFGGAARLIGKGIMGAGGALGRTIAKHPGKALLGGGAAAAAANTTVGGGLWDTMAGKFNAGVANALGGLKANMAAAGSLFSGDPTKAKNDAWNANQKYVQQQQQRADQGYNKATGWLGGAANRVAQPFQTIGAGLHGLGAEGGIGNKLEAAGRGINHAWNRSNEYIQRNDRQATTGIKQPMPGQPTPQAAQQPAQPGGAQPAQQPAQPAQPPANSPLYAAYAGIQPPGNAPQLRRGNAYGVDRASYNGQWVPPGSSNQQIMAQHGQ